MSHDEILTNLQKILCVWLRIAVQVFPSGSDALKIGRKIMFVPEYNTEANRSNCGQETSTTATRLVRGRGDPDRSGPDPYRAMRGYPSMGSGDRKIKRSGQINSGPVIWDDSPDVSGCVDRIRPGVRIW